MPPSRKEGPPQASPTSLASSSSAASPSRGKEPPQVDANICMSSRGPHRDKYLNGFCSIGHQCFHAVSTRCILAALFRSIVRLGVIMLYIQHPTQSVWAADIPQSSSGPVCPQSFCHPLFFCLLFLLLLHFSSSCWFHLSLINSFFLPNIEV